MMDTEFYTATMANVYAQQGHLERAAEIYRHLLEREPDRMVFKEALADIDKRLGIEAAKSDSDLVPLCRKWIQLLIRYRRLRQLKKCQKNISV
jgi:hypothetical protein